MKKNIIESKVILETAYELSKTFEELQKLKKMKIANYTSLIKHNEGVLLPAGAYNDYVTFRNCYFELDNLDYGDAESLKDADIIIRRYMVQMTENEKLYAYIGWQSFLRKKVELSKKQDTTAHKL